MQSLFLRMRLVHWLGAVLLFVNAMFFTDILLSQIIQYVIVALLIFHDWDEKHWGVDALKAITQYLSYFEQKNLVVPCDVNSSYNSEMSKILKVINAFRLNVKNALLDIKAQAGRSNEVSSALKNMSSDISERIQTQDMRVDKIARQFALLDDQSQQLKSKAEQTHQQVDKTRQDLAQSNNAMSQMSSIIDTYVQSSETMKSRFDSLSHQADAIGDVVSVINNLADQTNLLALNAAIEAARAGEHGRGFAVVADEVRQLAMSTQNSLSQIKQIISGISSAVTQAGEQIELQQQHLSDLGSHSNDSRKQVSKACDNIDQILNLIGNQSEMDTVDIRNVHNLVVEVAPEINQLKQLSSANAEDCQQLKKEGERLSEITRRIVEQLSAFKTR